MIVRSNGDGVAAEAVLMAVGGAGLTLPALRGQRYGTRTVAAVAAAVVAAAAAEMEKGGDERSQSVQEERMPILARRGLN
jgi:hypothetical protein